MKNFICVGFCIAVISLATPVSSQGWSCFAAGGKVYKCRGGAAGGATVVYDGSGATHARWSSDGTIIFFSKGSEIWAINNDGSNQRKIGTATTGQGSCIAAYRPEPKSVMVTEGTLLCKINSTTGEKTVLFDGKKSFYGELGISSDGTRVAARLGGSLYKATISNGNGTWSQYAGRCSAGISPNGKWLTENGGTHETIKLYAFEGGATKGLTNTAGGTWDNQAFSVNSDDWVSVLFDQSVGSNKGKKVGAHRISDDKTFVIGSVPAGQTTSYPDFFVIEGDLPKPSATTSVKISVSSTAEQKNVTGTRLSLQGNSGITIEPASVSCQNLLGQKIKASHFTNRPSATGIIIIRSNGSDRWRN